MTPPQPRRHVSNLYIGLMSGTSLDGVDGVLSEFAGIPGAAPRVLGHAHAAFDEDLRATLLQLSRSGPDELHLAALAANALMRLYAQVVTTLLHASDRGAVRAIGAHGQTVRHRPQAFDGTGYTLQLVNGALLAELTGIDVICDFRSRDVAAGGQGAPLVPALHAALFGDGRAPAAVLNLGGIANLTLLHAGGRVEGFDTGPANVLLDLWCRRQLGQPFDADGRFAASGQIDATLLARLLAEPYFERAPPKSTGRDLFDAAWLDRHLHGVAATTSAADIQATLVELTARSVADALQRHAPRTAQLLVCGGGTANADLMRRLRARLPAITVDDTGTRGVPPQQVEALAFAWLARAFVEREAGNLPTVTGARGPRILGALYPAG